MRMRWPIAFTAGVLVLASSAGGAERPRAATYVYDVQVSGSVLTREVDAGAPDGDGPIDLRLTYEIVFNRVAVRVNPVTKNVRTVVSGTKTGTTSGKFTFDSRVAKNRCAGGFDFKNLRATLTLAALGERLPEPRFELRAWSATGAEDTLLEQVEKVEGKCPNTRPGRAEPPSDPVPAGKGISVIMGAVPGVLVRRETWVRSSRPLAQLLVGDAFTLDTGMRRQKMPDSCEPGTCIRNLSGRVRVTFKPVR